MPIYEYYCPDNNRIYQFFAKTLAQGQTVPKCPDNPSFRMEKIVSAFAISTGGRKAESPSLSKKTEGDDAQDARLEAALGSMEKELSSVDENDPRAMGRAMRKMAELSGEKLDGEMEEVVRKLEEGADPDTLEDQLGDAMGDENAGDDNPYGTDGKPEREASNVPNEPRQRFKVRHSPPTRDPRLYDYE
jgi:hypothetical protein